MQRVLIAALSIACLDVRSAAACSCYYDFKLPRGDEVEVPVNLHDLVFPAVPSDQYALRAADDTAVPLGAAQPVWGDLQYMQLVPIAAPLTPSSTYTLWIRGAPTSFRTSAERDDEPPGAVGFEGVAIDYVERPSNGSTCGVNRRDFSGRLVIPPDAVSLWVRFRGDGQVQERLVPASERALEGFKTTYCGIRLDLTPDTTYELDVWARDLAGNEGPVATTSVYIRNVTDSGCSAAGSSSVLVSAIGLVGLLIRGRRVAGNRRRA